MDKFFKRNALFKWIRGLIFFPILLSCQMPSTSQEYDNNCNKRDSSSFEICIRKNFPIGSSYSDLKLFLTNQSFKQAKDPKDSQNFFYFFWWANDLSNYKVVVTGYYNNELKITEINIIP